MAHDDGKENWKMSNTLSSVKFGLALALICLLLNIALGIMFGVNEDWFQNYIKAGIASHPELHTPRSQDGIWRYVQRAHFHAGGIGAFSLGLILTTALSGLSEARQRITAALIGLSIFYPLSWLTMFVVAPSIGTKAAHQYWLVETFAYLGIGALGLGLLSVIAGIYLRSKSVT